MIACRWHSGRPRIRLLVLDVDGVLTDGRVTYTSEGIEIKSFHVRDGSALKYWENGGRSSGDHQRPDVARPWTCGPPNWGSPRCFQGCADKRVALGPSVDGDRRCRPRLPVRSATTCPICRCCGPAGWRWRSPTPVRKCGPRPIT